MKSGSGVISAGTNSVLVLLKISVAATFCVATASIRGGVSDAERRSAFDTDRVTKLRACGRVGVSERTNGTLEGTRKAEGSW